MKCNYRHNLYIDYLEGKLDRESQYKIEEHLRVCDSCMEFVKKLKETFSVIEEEKSVSPDPFMYTRIQSKLGSGGKHTPVLRLKLVFQSVAAAVLILLGIYTGKLIGQGFSDKKSLNTDYQTEVYYLYDVPNQLVNSELLSIKSE